MTAGSPGTLRALCAGASQDLVEVVAEQFRDATGVQVVSRFGPVGAMRESVLAGEACDVLIVSDVMMASLARSGEIQAGSLARLGSVATGLAVPSEDELPDISDPERLTSTLLASRALYLPDPAIATAGKHLVAVLHQLGISALCGPRLRPFPSGSAAMSAMARATGRGLVGCAQSTEILRTAGVRPAEDLPAPFQLSTVYTAGVGRRTADAELSRRFIELLAGRESSGLRSAVGFEAI